MQLKRPNLRRALALASCALVHGTAHAAEGDWKLAGDLLSYDEKDRVSVLATTLYATKDLGDEASLTLHGVYDSLSGASPNGAAPSNTPQTFTGASGKGSYTTAANKLPLQKFSDHREAFGLVYTTRQSSVSGRTLTGDISKETDYFSTGASATWTEDFNNKLTTFAYGIGGNYDLVQPKGFPTGLTSTNAAASTTTSCSGGGGGGGDDEGGGGGCGGEGEGKVKTTVNLLAGITQVLSRRTLMQFNYTLSRQDGYLTDPYKIISVVDPVTGANATETNATTGVTSNVYLFEKRPSERLSNAFFVKLVHDFDEDVVHLSYRYFTDDWGIRAHTAELQYRFKLGEHIYLEPQYHYHVQTAAKFFHNSLTTGQTPKYASADLRLGEMTDVIAGLKLGVTIGNGEFTVRYSKMTETGNSHPSDAIGVQKQVDLYPRMDVNIWNVGFAMPL